MLGFLKWDANHDNHGDSKHEWFKDSNQRYQSFFTDKNGSYYYLLSEHLEKRDIRNRATYELTAYTNIKVYTVDKESNNEFSAKT